MTDEWAAYNEIGRGFASHETVNHGDKEFARVRVTTNTVEGFYSIFKRGMKGIYQHLQREAFAPISVRVRFPLFQA
jgi:ISXO2-like transposase domain